MSAPDTAALDPRALRRAFERASARFDDFAVLHTALRSALLARLEPLELAPGVVVDLGAGTGHGARALRERWPRARVLAVDLAPGMLRAARARQSWRRRFDRICADACRLPLATGSADLVFSNLMLPWIDDLAGLLAEVRRVLAPGGSFSFASLGPDTLLELRTAWAAVDGEAHVHRFLDLHDVGDALLAAGWARPVMDVDRYTLTYADLGDLFRDLRGTGAGNVLAARRRGLGGRHRSAQLAAAYERFRGTDGRLPATVEAVFGQAWAAQGPAPTRRAPGETVVPLSRLGRR